MFESIKNTRSDDPVFDHISGSVSTTVTVTHNSTGKEYSMTLSKIAEVMEDITGDRNIAFTLVTSATDYGLLKFVYEHMSKEN